MKREIGRAGRRYAGVLVLGLVSAGVGLTAPGRHLCSRAQSVIHHYHELERAEVPTGFLSRIAYSLLLATADSSDCAQRRPTSS